MSLLGKRLVRNVTVATALLSSLFAARWYQKAGEFKPPGIYLSVSIDDSRLNRDCSMNDIVVCSEVPIGSKEPFSFNMSADPHAGIPWRYLRPWNLYEILQWNNDLHLQDAYGTETHIIGASIERRRKGFDIDVPDDTELKGYRALKIINNKRGQSFYIFPGNDNINVINAYPVIRNNGNNVLINYWDSKEQSPYRFGRGDVLSFDLETLRMKKINEGGYVMCAAAENNNYVFANSSKFGHEGYYIDPERNFSEKLWDDNLTRTNCAVSPDGKFVSFFTGVGAGVGYRHDGYNSITGKHVIGSLIYKDAKR